LPGFFMGERMWPFGASHESRAIRSDLRILAHGNLILIERLKLMNAQIEAFRTALDGFMARQAALASEVQPLKDQLTAVMAERDEALAALTEGASRMNADIPAEPQPEPAEPVV
jgi:hypothetical protein